jgi:hypothetical protein
MQGTQTESGFSFRATSITKRVSRIVIQRIPRLS